MSPALRDVLHQLGRNPLDNLEDLLKLLLVEGVKVGGIYKHWKGKVYVVRGVSRDADDWDVFLVTYVELTDARHEATRRVSYFLGDMNDERYVGPRFRLVG